MRRREPTMDQALATARSPLVGKRTFNVEYAPLRWRTVMLWGKAGRIKVIRIGRKCFLVREDVEQIAIPSGPHPMWSTPKPAHGSGALGRASGASWRQRPGLS
jgi:hypothetical protein